MGWFGLHCYSCVSDMFFTAIELNIEAMKVFRRLGFYCIPLVTVENGRLRLEVLALICTTGGWCVGEGLSAKHGGIEKCSFAGAKCFSKC